MTESNKSKTERRRFPRVMAPVYYRVAKSSTLREQVSNISLGGVRIYSDERIDEGERLELEFFLPSGSSVEAIARVVWIKELPPKAGALYDVGLEFIDLSDEAVEVLKAVLEDK